MTVSSTTRFAGPFACNGSTVAFTFGFKVFTASDVKVILVDANSNETTLILTTDYSVTLNADQDSNPGGTVTTVATYASGNQLSITSNVPRTQTLNLTLGGSFNPDNIEDALDRLIIILQQVGFNVDAAIHAPLADGVVDMELPSAAARANGVLGFDEDGNVSVVADSLTSAEDAAAQAAAASASATSAAASAVAAAASAASLNGDYTDEKFSNGVHFTSGVTTALTLSQNYGTETNLIVFWDGTWKNPDTYSLSGTTLTFTSAISATTVWVKAGKARPPADTSVFLQKAGGTMTGKIVLDGDPTLALHPSTKQYSDAGDATVSAAFATADDTISKLVMSAKGKQCPYASLAINYASASTLTVDATNLVLSTSGGVAKLFPTLSLTVNIAASGAAGLDTGAETANTWYHIWGIGKADGTVSAVLSTSTSAPTLPSGYTYYGYLGAIRNDGSSNFNEMYQVNRVAMTDAADGDNQLVVGGTSTSMSALANLVKAVPTTAFAVIGYMASVQTGASCFIELGPTTNLTLGIAYAQGYDQIYISYRVVMKTAQTMYYRVGTSDAGYVYVTGFEF